MASRWVVSNRGSTSLSFAELVQLARRGELSENDLIKAEWEPDWRPAHSVVGLFYRARRPEQTPHAAPEHSSRARIRSEDAGFSLDDLETLQPLESVDELTEFSGFESGWQKRLREVQQQRLTEEQASGAPDSVAPGSMKVLIDAAMTTPRTPYWSQRIETWRNRASYIYEWLNSPAALRLVFGLLAAAFSVWGVAHHAHQAALRFPRHDMPERFVVPILGDCTRGEFLFVLVDIALASMALIYFSGVALERWAESRDRPAEGVG